MGTFQTKPAHIRCFQTYIKANATAHLRETRSFNIRCLVFSIDVSRKSILSLTTGGRTEEAVYRNHLGTALLIVVFFSVVTTPLKQRDITYRIKPLFLKQHIFIS